MKRCFRCKTEKEEKEFSKRKSAKDGLHTYCKVCVSNMMKICWKDENVKNKQREWKKKHFESVKISNKKSYEKNRHNRLEKIRIYNEKNREKINARQRKYNAENRSKINEKQNIYGESEKGNIYAIEYYYKTKEKFKIQRNSRNKLRYAVRIGKIMKPEYCVKCLEKTKLHGHHEDYNKPLEVIWVCDKCHKKIHKGN